MIFTCKCLNITIESKESGVPLVRNSSVSTSPKENLEILKEGFKEIEIKKIVRQVDSLIRGRTVKNNIVQRCLNCSTDCYFLSEDKRAAFVNVTLISDLETISKLKNDRNFSPAFRIVIRPSEEHNIVKREHETPERLESAVTSLQKQLGEIVQDRIAKTEERIRTFSEQEYNHLKEFRERAHRDHRYLLETIYSAQRFFEKETLISVGSDVGKSGTSSVQIPIPKNKTETRTGSVASGLVNKERKQVQQHQRSFGVREKNGSFDSEGLFAIEGMEDWASDDLGRSEGESDTDHDDSGSHDEGIDVHRKKEAVNQLAKSLPVNVPVCTNVNPDFDRDDEPSDAVDIAASIKALARSLHGDAVFGDLPRPRFSTQI